MDEFFKNLKQKLSFENLQEFLTDDHEFEVASSKDVKENVREDVFPNSVSTDQQDEKPCYGVLLKPNESKLTNEMLNQPGMKTIDDSKHSDPASSSNQKTEESKGPEKKKSNPAIDVSLLF